MVTLNTKQFLSIVARGGRKKGDELWFTFASNYNVGLYITDSYCITTTDPYLLEYATSKSPAGHSARTGYSAYTLSPSCSTSLNFNRRNLTVSIPNLPQCFTSGSWDSNNPLINTGRTWTRVYAPTSYGTNWKNWLQAVFLNPQNYNNPSTWYFPQGQSGSPIYPNDHNWRKPFTKTQVNNLL